MLLSVRASRPTRLGFMFAAFSWALFACTAEQSATPTCATPEECNAMAVCQEDPKNPLRCCDHFDANSYARDECLCGFGDEKACERRYGGGSGGRGGGSSGSSGQGGGGGQGGGN